MDKFGPFVNVVSIVLALIAVFSTVALKAFGRVNDWTWMVANTPPFIVTTGARVLAIAIMGISYVAITHANYELFGVVALGLGVLAFVIIWRFDLLRRIHTVSIPVTGKSGSQAIDKSGKPKVEQLVIGTEETMRSEAAAALEERRAKGSGLSLVDFMGGYGKRVNNPEAIWDRSLLASIANRMTLFLMTALLLVVVAVFITALVIDTAT